MRHRFGNASHGLVRIGDARPKSDECKHGHSDQAVLRAVRTRMMNDGGNDDGADGAPRAAARSVRRADRRREVRRRFGADRSSEQGAEPVTGTAPDSRSL